MKDVAELPYRLAFREGVAIVEGPGGPVLRAGGRSLEPGSASASLRRALEVLVSGGASLGELGERAAPADAAEQAKILYYIERFKRLGLLTFTATLEGRALATLSPAAARLVLPAQPRADARYALSRFASLRREGSGL